MKTIHGLAIITAALALLVAISTAFAQGGSHPTRPGEVILKFRDNAPDRERSAILADLGASEVHDLVGTSTKHARIRKLSVNEAIARYRKHPQIEFIEPNYIYRASRDPNDPRFLEQWALRNTGQTGGLPGADTKATLAWDTFTGSAAVLVAIIDSGIDYNHPDLAANIYVNPGEIPGNGIDDDGNGYIDDVRGWNFVSNTNDPLDDHGHGTHVAGITGAVGNNAVGVAGMNWQIRLMPLKFLDASGSGTTAAAVSAIQYAVAMGVRAMNASWGGGGPSEALRLALVAADQAGVLFVAAAGNSGNDNDIFPDYPSSYDIPNIISVAATDHTDRLAIWSNYGAVSVDLAAPGVSILSTLPGSYGLLNGTSMAAPYVTGAVGLVLGRFPSIAAADAKNLILTSVDPVAGLVGKVATGGRLNAWLPIAEPDSLPPAPVADLVAQDANGTRVTLRWTASGDDGTTGTASRYEVRYLTAPIDESNFATAILASGSPQPQPTGSPETMQVRGLDFLTTYYFAVKVFDEFGNASTISNVATATTLGPPHVSATPESLTAALLSGQVTTQVFTLANTGESELNFDLRVEPVPGLIGLRLRPRVPGDHRIQSSAPQDALAVPYPPSQRPYDGGVTAPRARILPGAIRTLDLQSGTLRILVLQSGGDVSEIQNLLASFPDVAVVDMFNGESVTPTLADLSTYDTVLIANNRAFGDPAGVGNVIADYIDGGGGVVLSLASFIAGWELQGRFLSEGYSPFTLGSGPIGASSLGTFDATHPIMAGVTSATGDLLGDVDVSSGGELIASWVNGEPLVATKGSSVAAVNVFVGSSGYWTGDIPLILHNAAFWSTGAVSWLSMAPKSGIIPASQQVDIIATFDASRLDGGDYRAQIAVQSDDPSQTDLHIPVHLQVTGAPHIVVAGEDVVQTSAVEYFVDGALTVHTLPATIPPAGGGSIELLAEGDYGASFETATLTVEGTTLGSVGGVGTDCMPARRNFQLTPEQLASMLTDGQVRAEVQNSIEVNVFCVPNRHTVTLRYAPPADRVEFGGVFVGQTQEIGLSVTNGGSDMLEVTSITTDTGVFTPAVASLSVAPRTSVRLAVRFQPNAVAAFTGTLTLHSNDPDTPTVTVALSGAGLEPPIIGVQPAALSSTLSEGDQETQILTISNSGLSPLEFSLAVRPPLTSAVHSPFAGLSPFVAGASNNPPTQLEPPAQDQDTPVDVEPRFVGTAAEFNLLRPSPVPITCVVEDPSASALFGQENAGTAFYRYLASTDTWEPLASAPIYSGNNGGAALLNGKVYTTYTENDVQLGVYDIASNSWSTLPQPLQTGTANIASDGVQFLYLVIGFQLVRFDPSTGTSTVLASPPISFERWGGLRYLNGVLYGHSGNGTNGFAMYDIASNVWTRLPSVPGGAVLGAAIDPIAGEYVAYGDYFGTNLYRYDIRANSWSVNTIPFFSVMDGGLGWLGGTAPGIYFVEGESGRGLARMISVPEFLTLDPVSGTVPPLGSSPVAVRFDTGDLFGGTYPAEIVVTSNDPVTSQVVVPAQLTVLANPNIAVAGAAVAVESVVDYSTMSATTVHVLPVTVPPGGGGGVLDLVADGDFGASSETATLTVEGTLFGSAGGVINDCTPASNSFTLSAGTLAALIADGRVDATVQNSPDVDLFCSLNRHTVRLRYDARADLLDFGSLFVGLSRTLSIRVFNLGSAALEVTSIGTDRPEFTTAHGSLTVGPRSVTSLTVAFRPTSPGVLTGTLTLASNDPDQPLLTVALQGEGLIPPEIDVSPTAVSANLYTGDRTQEIVTITNSGRSDLELEIDVRGATLTMAKLVPAAPASGRGKTLRSTMSASTNRTQLSLAASTQSLMGVQKQSETSGGPEDGDTGPVNSRQSPRGFVAQPLGFSTMAGATTLIIEDAAPWGTTANEQVLSANGIAFDMIPSSALATTDLSRYDLVLVPSDQPTSFYSRLAAQKVQLDAYVSSGGVLEFHAAGWGWNFGDASLVTLPDGMRIQYRSADYNYVVDPSHPLVAGVPTRIVGNSASHSSFSAVPATASVVVTDDAGQPNLVVYNSGRGQVIAGGQTFEHGYIYGYDVGLILQNMIPYAHAQVPMWLSAAPLAATVPAGMALELVVGFDATGLLGGDYSGMILVNSNDPDEPTVEVTAQMHVTGAPDIRLLGRMQQVASTQTYQFSGARTTHSLPITVPPGGGGTLELFANGDYGNFSETATVTVEGQRLGNVGETGYDCAPDSAAFAIAAADLARWVADGRVDAEVQNSTTVDAFCSENSHTVRLSYRGSAEVVNFGRFFVGLCKSRRLEVANVGTDVLTVSAVSTSHPDVTVDVSSFALLPGQSRELVLTFCPTSPGVLAATLTVNSNDPSEPQLTAALQGEGLVPPDIDLSPTSLTSTLPIPSSETQTLTISNTGGSDLDFAVRTLITANSVAVYEAVALGKGDADPRPGVLGTGGPDVFGYTWYDSDDPSGPAFDWVDITAIGTPLPLSGDDANQSGVPLGFDFPFYGNTFNTVNVCTNGWLSFTNTGAQYVNYPLPSGGAPENLLSMFWSDLYASYGSIYSYRDGSRFVVAYVGVQHLGGDGPYTFEVILYPSGRIVYQYLDMQGSSLGRATIGIQNAARDDGLTVAFNAAYVHSNLAIEFRTTPDWLLVSPTSGTVPAGGSMDLQVLFNSRDLLGGVYNGTLQITSNDPDEALVNVPATLTAIGTPDIGAVPASLDFGRLYVGQSRDLALVVRNEGSDVLTITGASSTNPAYALLGVTFPLTIGIRGEAQVTVRFAPTGECVPCVGDLVFLSNDPDEGEFHVGLQGVGLVPPDIDVSPTAVNANLYTCGREQKIVTITNSGRSDLEFEISIRGATLAMAKLVPEPTASGRGGLLGRTAVVTPKRAQLPGVVAALATDFPELPRTASGPGEDESGRLSPQQAPRDYAVHPLGISTMAGARTLIIQDAAPWGTMANEQVLSANGIVFDMIPSMALAATDLSRYALVLVPSDQPTSYYSHLAAQKAQLDAFVSDGGVLEFHAAGWGWNGGDASLVTLPDGMRNHLYYANSNTVLDPAHPLVAGVPSQFFHYPSHSYFTDIPATASLVVADDNGRPNLVVYNSGRGQVIAGGQTFEWGYVNGAETGRILENMVPYTHSAVPTWLSVAPLAATVPAGAALELVVTFDAADLIGGDYFGKIAVNSNDPDEPTVEVAARLHVTDAPCVSLLGELEQVESTQTYQTSGALTTHVLPVAVSPGGGGTLELIANGDYSYFTETATVTVEGQRVGEVGRVGTDCTPASDAFDIAAADLARWVADGRVDAEVQNSFDVDAFCAENSHTVRLNYRGRADVVDFGQFFTCVCQSRRLEVANFGSAVLTVSSVSTSHPDVTVDASTFTVPPGGSRELILTYCPSSPGVLSGTLTLRCDDPDDPELTVPLQGEGIAPPEIAVDPLRLNEDLLVGQTSTQSLRIANGGGSPLTVQLSLRTPVAQAVPVVTAAASTRERETPQRMDKEPAFYQEKYQRFTAPAGAAMLAPRAAAAQKNSGGSPQRLDATVIFFDDMESGTNGWSHYSTHANGVDRWGQTTARSTSGTTSWNVAQHDFEGSDALQSPAIDLTGYVQATLTFSHFYKFDDCGGDPSFEPDGGIVEVSTDGGAVWQQIFPVGGYPFTLDDICYNPLAYSNAYAHGSGLGFLPAVFDLSPFAGHSIRIRFQAGWDCGNCQYNEGWYIDDVFVTSETPRWVSVSPIHATIDPQQVLDVQVAFDARMLSVGSYDAELVISSNDCDESVLVLPVNLQVWDTGADLLAEPRTVNLGRRGQWITSRVEFAAGLDPTNVIVPTVRFNRDAAADLEHYSIGDQDGDGIPELMLKFDMQAVRQTLSLGDEVRVIVTGEMAGGQRFLGNDALRVIRPQLVTPNGGEILTSGEAYTIRWSVPNDWSVSHVDLAYSVDGGISFTNIATGIVGTSYEWSVPRVVTTRALVRVTVFDGIGMLAFDTSDAVLEIQGTPSARGHDPYVDSGLWLQSSPNPFTSGTATRISFRVPKAATVSVKVYNVAGQLVRTLRSEAMPAGTHLVPWDGLDDNRHQVAAGVYFCRLRVAENSVTRRLLLLR